MAWLRFKMDLTAEPSEDLQTPEDSQPSLSEDIDSSVFPETFEPTAKLVEGQLSVIEDNQEILSLKATSGLQEFQYFKAQRLIGRGPIPSCKKIGIDAYTVRTSLFDLENPESEENFYYIEPDPIDVDGVMRGEFGIQFDSSLLGSAGSIILREQEEWQQFKKFMKDYLGKGFAAINLIVEYTVEGRTIQAPQFPDSSQSIFKIDTPQPGERRKVKEPIEFSGTAQPQISKIIATVEPEKTNLQEESKLLYLIGEVTPTDGKWSFNQTLVNTGIRPFKFRALDEFGNLVQAVKFDLVIE